MKVLVIDDIRTYEDALKLNADILHNGKHTKGKVSIDSGAEVTLIKGVSAPKSEEVSNTPEDTLLPN